MNVRTLALLAIAALAIGLVFLLGPRQVTPAGPAGRILGTDARLVGSLTDPFAYAGGDTVRSLEGDATLQFDSTTRSGTLRFEIHLPDAVVPEDLPFGVQTGSRVLIRASVGENDALWIDSEVCGNTGNGDNRLPQTHALLAGRSTFAVSVDGQPADEDVSGLWLVSDALRRDNGSIGQQGLVFSPLLREKTGFSDPSRREITLLLYGNPQDGADPLPVLLDLVYRSVTVDES